MEKMKPRLIFILSLAGVLVLISIQFYIVRQVYSLKTREFDYQYRKMVQEGTAALTLNFHRNGFDSVYVLLDNYSYFFLTQLDTMNRADDREMIMKTVVRQFSQVVSRKEYLTSFLKYYLNQNRVDTNIYTGIRIRELSLLGRQKLSLVSENDSASIAESGALHDPYRGASFINTYRAEGNFYSILFDYYVDFTHKTRIVLRDMTGILVLSVISILAVGLVFTYTILNLLRQKKLSDLKSEFISNITHELKTPLTTIAVAAQSISNEQFLKDEKKVLELSGIIARQNKYLSHLINNVLDISFWDKEGISLTKKTTDLALFMNDYLKGYNLRLKGQPVNIDSRLTFNGELASIDAAQLSTVLNNLLDNALKFSGENPTVLVESFVENAWIIKVTDHGCGISREDMKNIFEKFYRGSNVRKEKTRGLGLGLYNARRIVEEHGGTISVESEPGKGSAFTIHLPIN
jgi:two-component system phosphate regulon sensor histidine kinase PhoR